jgi:asparagine synthase (glutamine-hydrolysing)
MRVSLPHVCGIAGLAGLDTELDQVRQLLGRMCAAVVHRGPDGGGTTLHPDAAIGMTRLAIVDIAHGNQPMLTDDESIALVFNGEIYNAPALRAELEKKGVHFRTRSDTEVILRLYERDPNDVEQHLRGMWAFAVHDRKRRQLVLSRDRFGIKPLYVAKRGRAVAFGSEVKALRVVADRKELAGCFAIDHGSAHAMLSWSYIPNEATIFAGVKKLAPCTRMTIDLATGAADTRAYYTLKPSDDAMRVKSLEAACALVEPMLESAVKEHLESDVPIATFMSGGIDSSLVAAYAAAQSKRPLTGYSIGFREPRFDESPHARETAAKLGIELTVTYLDEDAARASLGDALVAYDEPFGDSSSLATYLLSAVVGRNHKVALGGDGGDEAFAGYRKHRVIRLRDVFASTPAVRDGIADLLGRVPARTDRTSRLSEALRTTRRLARGLGGDDARAYLALTQIAPLLRTAPLVRAPADDAIFEQPILDVFEHAGGSQLQRTLASDLANVLPNDMLVKVDRASMACHLEARVPFLDHRVVEIGIGLPEELTLGGSGKRVLRTLHERKFGAKLAKRGKQGFGVPVERWLRGPLQPACAKFFSKESIERFGILSPDLANDWRSWAEKDPQILWNCFALAAWCEATLGDGPDAVRTIVS